MASENSSSIYYFLRPPNAAEGEDYLPSVLVQGWLPYALLPCPSSKNVQSQQYPEQRSQPIPRSFP